MKDGHRRLLEGAVVVLGLTAFWPPVLGYAGLWYQLGVLALLALLIWVAIMRIRRVARSFDDIDIAAPGRTAPLDNHKESVP